MANKSLKNTKINFVIIGPQASGKGTQARMLAKKLQLAYFSMGEICRLARDRSDELGSIARRHYDQGKLYPESLTFALAEQALKNIKIRKGIIFEGYPRTTIQIKDFKLLTSQFDLSEPWVIYLEISRETILKRIVGRKVCSLCSRPYLPAEVKNVDKCSKCSGKLITRPDDQPKAIKHRLNIYFKQTVPVINYYKHLGKLIKIDGEPDIKTVYQQILQLLANKKII